MGINFSTKELIDQAYREKRVLLTRDAKLFRHEYLLSGQIYRVKSLLKNEQLLEVCVQVCLSDACLEHYMN